MYRTALILISASLLSACGGSSSGDSSNTSADNQSKTKLKTLSMVAIYKDACGNETFANDAALLIHNSDYSNKDIIYADANGKLSYQTESATQTISILMRNKNEVDGVKPVILTTYMDYPVKDIGNYYHNTYAKDACDCQNFTLNVNVPARANDWAEGKLSGAENQGWVSSNQGSAQFNDLSVCRTPEQTWPLLSSTINFTDPDEAFGVLIADVSDTTEVDATLAGTIVDIATNSDLAYKRISTVINGERHFNNSISSYSTNNLYAFTSTPADYYTVSAYTFDNIYEFPNVDEAILIVESGEHTEDLSKTFDLTLPAVDYTKMFDILLSDTGQYDLSDTANMDYINVNISANKDFQSMLTWTITAPTSGLVPKIENIDISAFVSEDILNTSVNNINTSISMEGLSGINGYKDYTDNVSERTVENYTQEKWSKSEWVFFRLTIKDVAFDSSTSPFNLSNAVKSHISDTGTHKISHKKISKKTDDVANLISARLLTK
ncbi:MAG: hypothetical protein GY928_13545 [Colwellia sp.]|nr:hypothetical protein [Colwellia sp.]